jgi:hypothetical protein
MVNLKRINNFQILYTSKSTDKAKELLSHFLCDSVDITFYYKYGEEFRRFR